MIAIRPTPAELRELLRTHVEARGLRVVAREIGVEVDAVRIALEDGLCVAAVERLEEWAGAASGGRPGRREGER